MWDDLSVRRHFIAVVVLALTAACSSEAPSDASDAADSLGEIPPPTTVTTNEGESPDTDPIPGDPPSDGTASPDPSSEPVTEEPDDGSDRLDGGDPEPFEPEPVTPAEPGVDIDDVLRDEQEPAPATTAPNSGDAVPGLPVAPLAAGPLPWTLRRAVAPDDVAVALLVEEAGCDGALTIPERLVVEVTEGPEVVEIAVSRASAAAAERAPCETNPFTPVVVPLGSPLGSRLVVDPGAGSIGVAPTPVDDLSAQPSVRVSVAVAGTTSSTSTSIDDTEFAVVVDCAAGGGIGRDWRPATEFASPELVVTAGADALERVARPWHEFVVRDGDDRGIRHDWVLATDGVPVGHIQARRGALGWVGTGTACPAASGEERPPFDTSIDASIGTGPDGPMPSSTAPTLDTAAMSEWVGVPAGMEFEDGAYRFVDAARRCRGWHAIEDGLLAGGFVLGPERSLIDPSDVVRLAPSGTATLLQRQVARRVDAPDGRSALLVTAADGSVVTTAVDTRVAESPTRLRPCLLDGETGSVPVIVS